MKCHIALLMLCAYSHAVWGINTPTTLSLLGRSSVHADESPLSNTILSSLKEQRLLRVGISDPDYPPFEITNHANEFEGVSADYLGLIKQLLKLDVQILRYRSRDEVILALKRGEIDLLPSANEFEASDPDLQLTLPYIIDQPVLVERAHDAHPVNSQLAGKTIAMVNHYLPLSTVKTFYPEASFELYPSIVAAVSAVAFAKADIYLGDSISTGYLINKSYLSNVQLADYPEIKVNHFAFALKRTNTVLMQAINAALLAIPSHQQLTIANRWSATQASTPGASQLRLSDEETRWLADHPQLRVIAHQDFLPFSFFNENQRLRGLSADVLAMVNLKTGLKFVAQKNTSLDSMIRTLRRGDVDLIAALTPSPDRDEHISFSRPYFAAPYVLITQNTANSPGDLHALNGKRLAIISGSAKKTGVEKRYPDIKIVSADNHYQALLMVARGEVEGALGILTSAEYLIDQSFQESLKIASTVGSKGAQLAFAVNPDSPLLLSILNKALLSIGPEEMREITNRWRKPLVPKSYWEQHRTFILHAFAICGGLLIISGIWIVLLRRQILKRKIVERTLSERLKFVRVLIDGTPHPIYVRDNQGRLLACNSAYREVFGVTDERFFLGKTLLQSTFASNEQAQEYHRDYLHAMAHNTPQIRDRQMILPGGQVRTIQHWILPYQNNDDQIEGLIGGWVDVSDRQHLMEQLKAAKDQADKANSAKTLFLSTMSHEIRTPMNAILGMLELAAKKAEQGVLDLIAINVASEASRGLLALIGDILDISSIESRHTELSLHCDNPHTLLTGVATVFDGLAREKALQLFVDIAPAVNHAVMIDALRFKQVVANLLSNAIKFTNTGHVRMRAGVLPQTDSQVMRLQVSIEDSGVGISATDQQRLFSAFSRVGDTTLATGSGLGLAISLSLAQIMGGTLELSSKEAQGTHIVFTLDLPMTTSSPVQQLEAAPARSALSVLIVDDCSANRMVLRQQLTYLGHEVHEAQSGARAWDLWSEQPFDVVVTDCNMPGMNGYELARLIRRREQELDEPGCMLLGFTASAVPKEKQRCLDAGMDDCLFKPINLQQLSERLQPLQAAYFSEDLRAAPSIRQIEEQLSAFTFGNHTVMQELKNELASNSRADIELLAHLVQGADRESLAEFAHRVKGSARLIQYDTLLLCCANLEAAGDVSVERLTDLAGALERCLVQLVECLSTQRGRVSPN